MKRRIVILGGGTGETLVANRLHRMLGNEGEIVVVDRTTATCTSRGCCSSPSAWRSRARSCALGAGNCCRTSGSARRRSTPSTPAPTPFISPTARDSSTTCSWSPAGPGCLPRRPAVSKLEPEGPHAYKIDLGYCNGCRLCAQACPWGRSRCDRRKSEQAGRGRRAARGPRGRSRIGRRSPTPTPLAIPAVLGVADPGSRIPGHAHAGPCSTGAHPSTLLAVQRRFGSAAVTAAPTPPTADPPCPTAA